MGLSRKRLLLVKLESAYKTDASPSSGADAILCANLDGFQPMAGETVTRNIVRAYFGNGETYQATTYGTATFTVELAGTSGAPTSTNLPQYDALLKACGFTTAVTSSVWTATPSTPSSNSENNTSVTIAYHQDGLLHKLIGARGTVSFEFTNKQLPEAYRSLPRPSSPLSA